jgi:hypothetical protein
MGTVISAIEKKRSARSRPRRTLTAIIVRSITWGLYRACHSRKPVLLGVIHGVILFLQSGTGWHPRGGTTIADVLRRTWSCLIQRQWLFLYPLVLSLVNTLAFFSVYAAQGEELGWSAFFRASFYRAEYLRDHFFVEFAFTSRLLVPLSVGVGLCLVWALVQAPFFRAITGNRYPLAPRGWAEVAGLFLFYLVWSLVVFVAPLAAPEQALLAQIIYFLLLVLAIFVVFADYIIVFEGVGSLRGVQRSLRLVRLRIVPVVVLVIAIQLVYGIVAWLYGLYYEGVHTGFTLLPISQVLVDTIIALFAQTLLVFLYQDLRCQSPAAPVV